MAQARAQHPTDRDLFYLIENGVRWSGMRAWKREHTREANWRLVSFIRHIAALMADEMRQIVLASGHEHGKDDTKRKMVDDIGLSQTNGRGVGRRGPPIIVR